MYTIKNMYMAKRNTTFCLKASRRRHNLSAFKFHKMREFLDQLNYHPLFKDGSV
jgi:hypothetical protein